MKYLYNILFIAAFATTSFGQSIDDERMYRDLQVAENALGTIISPNDGDFPRWNFDEKNIEAGYVKDYGVVFMVDGRGFGSNRYVTKLTGKNIATIMEEDDDAKEEVNEKEEFIENSKIFLADYAGIIGQLQENQKISIRRGGGNSHGHNLSLEKIYYTEGKSNDHANIVWTDNKQEESELIIETTVADINALRKGSMNRDKFFESVNVIENVMSYEKDADLETLTAMFHRLYEKDLSKTYYSDRKPKYSKLSNFGIIVKMKVYSSYEDNHVYSMPTISRKDLTLSERNNLVMELLPQFESDFKENIVNYARTLKNLDSDEIILFEVNMTTCNDCKDFPKTMKFSIKKSVLNNYNRGSVTMDQAVNSVNVDHIIN